MATSSLTNNPDGLTVSERGASTEVHDDPYPSRPAMEAAVELEVHAALGRVQTQTVGKVIQRAINKTLKAQAAALDMLHALKLAETVWSNVLANKRGGTPSEQREPVLNCIRAAIDKAEAVGDRTASTTKAAEPEL